MQTETGQTGAASSEIATLLSRLDAPLQTDPSVTKYINPETKDLDLGKLVASHLNAQAKLGAPVEQIVRLPKDDDAAEWAKVYDRLGRPADPKDYDFGVTFEHPADVEFTDGFRKVAHDLGLSQKQLQSVMGYYNGALDTLNQRLEADVVAQREAAEASLKSAWGAKYDHYRNEVPATLEWLAQQSGLVKAGDAAALETFKAELNAEGLSDNPLFLRLLAAVADQRAEPGSPAGQAQTGGMGPQDAKAKLMEKELNPDWTKALYDRNHPQHNAVVEERARLLIASKGA